jgi:hypothetical protein
MTAAQVDNFTGTSLQQFLYFVPVVVLAALVLAPESATALLQGPVGKGVLIVLIVLYSALDWVYGLFVCLLYIAFLVSSGGGGGGAAENVHETYRL